MKNWATEQLHTMWNDGSWVIDWDYSIPASVVTLFVSNRLFDFVHGNPDMDTFSLSTIFPWECVG